MNDREKQAFALGYLRGLSPILWSIEPISGAKGIQYGCEDAAFFDEQVDVLAKAFAHDKEAVEHGEDS